MSDVMTAGSAGTSTLMGAEAGEAPEAIARLLAHDHQRRIQRPLPRHRLGGVLPERAAAAGGEPRGERRRDRQITLEHAVPPHISPSAGVIEPGVRSNLAAQRPMRAVFPAAVA